MGTFVIVRYGCEVGGRLTESIDYQVRYFVNGDEEEILKRLTDEEALTYKNEEGETVKWIFREIITTEENPTMNDGQEIIGFTTSKTTEEQMLEHESQKER